MTYIILPDPNLVWASGGNPNCFIVISNEIWIWKESLLNNWVSSCKFWFKWQKKIHKKTFRLLLYFWISNLKKMQMPFQHFITHTWIEIITLLGFTIQTHPMSWFGWTSIPWPMRLEEDRGRAMAQKVKTFFYLECSAQNKEGVREVLETATMAALLQVKSIEIFPGIQTCLELTSCSRLVYYLFSLSFKF